MTDTRLGGAVALWASLVIACGTPSEDDDASSADATSTITPPGSSSDPSNPTASSGMPPGTTSASSTGSPPDTGTTEAVEDTGPPVYFDLGELPDTQKIDEACGAVDFLFVIDNSGSMLDEQINLVNSFPGFITAIQNTLEQVNEYNIGVVTSDAYSPNLAIPGCNVLGGLVRQTGGSGSSNADCGPYADGNAYMTEADDLQMTFACAAQVGTNGDPFEQMMSGLLNAVDGPLLDPGACNEGFIREDALLVLVIITDEYDGPGDPESNPSPGTPMEWYDQVVAVKGGIPENVVVVSLVNAMGGSCPPASTVFDGVNIVDFTTMFGDNGLVGGVCDMDYSVLFADAVSIIDVACDNFEPPN